MDGIDRQPPYHEDPGSRPQATQSFPSSVATVPQCTAVTGGAIICHPSLPVFPTPCTAASARPGRITGLPGGERLMGFFGDTR